MRKEAAAELGLEPGALRRHQQIAIADGEQLVDRCGEEHQPEIEAVLADAPLDLACAADTADEIDAGVAARIGDAEDRVEQLILDERAVERGDGIGRVERAGADGGVVPAASEERRKRPLRGGLGGGRFGDVEAFTEQGEQRVGGAALLIANHAIVRENLHLPVREDDHEEGVVLFALRIGGSPSLPCGGASDSSGVDARGSSAAVVTVGDVQVRDAGAERLDEDGAVAITDGPKRVLDAVVGGEVFDGRGAGDGGDDLVDRVVGAVREEDGLVVGAERVDVAHAIVFFVGARLLVFADRVVVVLGDARETDDAHLPVIAEALSVQPELRRRVFAERAFFEQTGERDAALGVDLVGVLVDALGQIDLWARDAQEAVIVAFSKRPGLGRRHHIVRRAGYGTGETFGRTERAERT